MGHGRNEVVAVSSFVSAARVKYFRVFNLFKFPLKETRDIVEVLEDCTLNTLLYMFV